MESREASEWEDIHPGRCKHLQLPYPSPFSSPSTLSVSVCVLDAPYHLEATRPFAAILVPRGQELDWIFCTPNGLWDLLFSASVSRLVVIRRVIAIHNSNEEDKEEQQEHRQAEEQRGALCTHLPFHPRLKEKYLPGTSQPYPLCTVYVNVDDDGDNASVKKIMAPLLLSLFPFSLCPHGPLSDPYVTYEDHVRSRHILEICHSKALGGDILVEDVELDCSSDEDMAVMGVEWNKHMCKLRRRMRFQKMPNLIQTEVPIAIYNNGHLDSTHGLEDVKVIQELEVRPDNSKLVHKYLPPIVAGLVLASPCLEACMAANTRARFLSIGLGGGALPLFLHRQFGFSVVAVDTDEVVVELARRHFGLVDNEHLQVHVKDGIDVVFSIAHQVCRNNCVSKEVLKEWQAASVSKEVLKEWQAASNESSQELWQSKILSAHDCIDARVHVIVVDVNVADTLSSGLLSPPPCFLTRAFLLAVRMALREGGMLVMNVIARVKHSLNDVVNSLRKVFSGIYQIQIEDNYVLFAFPFKIDDINMSCSFARHVAHAVGGDLFDHIEEVEESIYD